MILDRHTEGCELKRVGWGEFVRATMAIIMCLYHYNTYTSAFTFCSFCGASMWFELTCQLYWSLIRLVKGTVTLWVGQPAGPIDTELLGYFIRFCCHRCLRTFWNRYRWVIGSWCFWWHPLLLKRYYGMCTLVVLHRKIGQVLMRRGMSKVGGRARVAL